MGGGRHHPSAWGRTATATHTRWLPEWTQTKQQEPRVPQHTSSSPKTRLRVYSSYNLPRVGGRKAALFCLDLRWRLEPPSSPGKANLWSLATPLTHARHTSVAAPQSPPSPVATYGGAGPSGAPASRALSPMLGGGASPAAATPSVGHPLPGTPSGLRSGSVLGPHGPLLGRSSRSGLRALRQAVSGPSLQCWGYVATLTR